MNKMSAIRFSVVLGALFVVAAGVGPATNAAVAMDAREGAQFCMDYPMYCSHCSGCVGGQASELTITNPKGESVCAAHGGTVMTDAQGGKICAGQYLRKKLPGKMKSGQLPN